MISKTIAFDIGKKVFIPDLERPGVVTAITIDHEGTQYRVRYFDNAEARSVYFYDWELKDV